MKRSLKIIEVFVAVLALAIFMLPAGCVKKINAPEYTPGTLIITGNGVEQPCRFTVDELKGLQEAVVSERYSTVNSVGTKNFFVGRGVQLSYLLAKAGILAEAQTIKISGSDGYTIVLTRKQLGERRFYYPGLMAGSEKEAVEVPAILAWEHREGSRDLSQARSGGLRLLMGQTGLSSVVVPAFVRNVALIEVSTSEAGRWEPVSAEPAPGKVEPGTGVVLDHADLDAVKIYYTLDGSEPNEKSTIYNPSTTYFKPELNLAITVNQAVTIKALAVGFGKNDSDVAVFSYEIQ
ncbi:MAG: chitobiase/beta-hexosaminidase C-terminal domain-containing protein [Desulfotomaculaceae bacterium]|nr:chitobiase/beta-hexosaminidase C-terminal domain-containing protein [Desulfotomaculaceae bacterium]